MNNSINNSNRNIQTKLILFLLENRTAASDLQHTSPAYVTLNNRKAESGALISRSPATGAREFMPGPLPWSAPVGVFPSVGRKGAASIGLMRKYGPVGDVVFECRDWPPLLFLQVVFAVQVSAVVVFLCGKGYGYWNCALVVEC